MPTKKKSTNTRPAKDAKSFDFQKLVNGSDSYKSLIYGIVTVVVLFIVIALGIRTLQQNKAQIDEQALSTHNINQQNNTSKYVVVEGDTLWSIAEKEYNDGFRWNEIAKANNITNATTLEKGMQLTIPELEDKEKVVNAQVSPAMSIAPTANPSAVPTLEPTKMMVQEKPVAQNQKINGTDYKIVSGDTLWDISIRAYGNGYRWVEIARMNKLVNPDLIYPGDSLKLPRP